jgi:peptidoglycan/LPS O-acetylase OafA/YrhL
MLGQPTLQDADLATTPRRFRPDVEGLRAIAIAIVVLYHYELGPFSGGYVGVDVFFVISGFVITSMLLREREKNQRTSLLDFYARRMRRILPAAALVIVATSIATFIVLGVVQGESTAADARSALLFFANFHFAAQRLDYFTSNLSPSPLVHYWSLSIEEQFYFVWPTLLLLGCSLIAAVRDRMKLGIILCGIIAASFAYSVILTSQNQPLAYYSSFTRAWELAMGALVAVAAPLVARIPKMAAAPLSWIGVAGIFIAACTFSSGTAFPGYAVALPVLSTALVIASGSRLLSSGAELLLGSAPFLWLGALSYSLYLWHWPIWAIASQDLNNQVSIPVRIYLLIAAVVVSYGSFRLVENPVRRSKYLAARQRLSIAIGLAIIALSLVVVTVVNSSWPTPTAWNGKVPAVSSLNELDSLLTQASTTSSLPGLVVPLSKIQATEFPSTNGCLVSDTAASATGTRPTSCTWGDTRSKTVLVLYGDSQAAMWLPTFDLLGKQHHWKVELYARAACRIADLQLWDYPLNGPGIGCTLWHNWAVSHINALHPRYIVVADHALYGNINYNRVRYSQAQYVQGDLRTIHMLEHHGTSIVLLGPIPQPSSDPAECLSRNSGNIQACSTSRSLATGAVNYPSVTALSIVARLPLISTVQWFCTTTSCPTVVNHTVMYFDADHVSVHFATMLTGLMDAALVKAKV